MNGLAVGMREAGIGFLVALVLLVLTLGLLGAVVDVFRQREGRRARLKKAAKRIAGIVGVVLTAVASFSYYPDARERAAAIRFHNVRSNEDGGIYTARYAYLTHDRILLRVYRTAGMTLLAERTYADPDAAMLIWTKHSLIYDTAATDGEGLVALPPSWVDRWLAKLP